MGFRCLLGHDFDAPETERERDEQGSEVIVTVREVKVCSRCGKQQVVSENKEVTSLEAAFGRPTEDEATDVPAETSDLAETEVSEDVPTDDSGASHPTETADEEFEPPTSAEEDDGVILDKSDYSAPDRKPGEWPPAPDVRTDEDDEDDEATEQGGIVLDDAVTPATNGAAATVEDDAAFAEDEGHDAEFIPNDSGRTLTGTEAPDGPLREGDWSEGAPGTDLELEDTTAESAIEYYCPECGLTRSVGDSSMRAGDSCPECHVGYIEEQER